MLKLQNDYDIELWLATRPFDHSFIIAARSALRVAPLVGEEAKENQADKATFWRNLTLVHLRCLAVPFYAARYPTHETSLREVAKALTDNLSKTGNLLEFIPYASLISVIQSNPYAASDVVAVSIDMTERDIVTKEAAAAALIADADALGNGYSVAKLSSFALWNKGIPDMLSEAWQSLKATLLAADEDWEVWTDWYDALLEGRLAESEAISLARVTLPEEFWERGPKAVNAELKRLIEAKRAQTPPHPIPEGEADAANTTEEPAPPPPLPLPSQGHGPHFDLPQGRLDFTPPALIDGKRNDLRRLRTLHPLLRDQVAAAVELFGRNAAHGRLLDVLAQYSAALDHQVEGIDYEILTGIGLQLANAEKSARRDIADRLKPEFEDDEKTALTSLLDLHGPFVLASEAGRNLLDDVERYRRSEADEAAFREDAAVLAAALVDSPAVAAPEPAAFIAATVAEIGRGDNPSRTAVYGVGVVKNATVVLAGGAVAFTLATLGVVAGGMWIGTGAIPAWVIYKGIEASKPFKETTKLIADLADAAAGADWSEELVSLRDRNLKAVADFVRTHSDRLDRLAGDRREWQWLRDILKWLRDVDRR